MRFVNSAQYKQAGRSTYSSGAGGGKTAALDLLLSRGERPAGRAHTAAEQPGARRTAFLLAISRSEIQLCTVLKAYRNYKQLLDPPDLQLAATKMPLLGP